MRLFAIDESSVKCPFRSFAQFWMGRFLVLSFESSLYCVWILYQTRGLQYFSQSVACLFILLITHIYHLDEALLANYFMDPALLRKNPHNFASPKITKTSPSFSSGRFAQVLKWDPALFFWGVVLPLRSPQHGHVYLRINLAISTKVLVSLELNLPTNLGRNATVTVSSLLSR